MKLYSYVIVHDSGFAPNPYWGFCTLAVCTPNHMGIRPQNGDWIMGTEPVKRGNQLVYAMQVNEALNFHNYFSDPKFEKKKPIRKGTYEQRCGDNIYYKDTSGVWQQYDQTFYHREPNKIKQDLKHPYVFIAELFYYFGSRSEPIPPLYQSLVFKRGVKCRYNPEVIKGFLDWLCSNFEPGIHGEPHLWKKNVNRY